MKQKGDHLIINGFNLIVLGFEIAIRWGHIKYGLKCVTTGIVDVIVGMNQKI